MGGEKSVSAVKASVLAASVEHKEQNMKRREDKRERTDKKTEKGRDEVGGRERV